MNTRMNRITFIVNLLLLIGLALPAMPAQNCCCKRDGEASCGCCCSSSQASSHGSCCKSKQIADSSGPTISRRCDCKTELAASTYTNTVKPWKTRTRKEDTQSIAQNSLDLAIGRLAVRPLQPTHCRAPPEHVRLHILDCRWLV